MWLEISVLAAATFIYVYCSITKNYGYFKARGFPEDEPTFPFGSSPTWELVKRKSSIFPELDDLMKRYPHEKYIGTYAFGQKTLVIKDLHLAKKILIKDADHFTDRRSIKTEGKTQDHLIFENFLTQLKGDKWKRVRNIVSPVFTSGKLKIMISHVDKCAGYLEEFLDKASKNSEALESKDVFGKLALDAIATSGFGIEHNSFKHPNSKFRHTALRMIRAEGYSSKWDLPKLIFIVLFPKLSRKLGFSFLPKGTTTFFATIIRRAIESRRQTGLRRNDIIDLLIDELKEQKANNNINNKEHEDEFEKNASIDLSSVEDIEVDMEIALISNAIIFFFAGFDTISTTLGLVMFGLATHPHDQNKVRKEIYDIVGDSSAVTFQQMRDLKYMENFINECARFYSLVNVLERVCTKDYKLPGTNLTVPTGMIVQVAHKGFADECFANAHEFDPDNFLASNKPDKFGFSSFGQGPRSCLGMRYAMMVMKLALVHTLANFKVVPCAKTVSKLEFNATKTYFKGGIWFKVVKIKEED